MSKKLKVLLTSFLIIILFFLLNNKKVDAVLPEYYERYRIFTSLQHCPGCGDKYTMDVVDSGGMPATCIYSGYSYDIMKCNGCAYTCILAVEDSSQNALGHYFTPYFTVDKSATCTETGQISRHCTRCDSRTDINVINALGHNLTVYETQMPECTTTGTKLMECTNSGCAYKTTEEIPATGHTEVVDEAVAATCTETGLTEGKHCSVCKAVLVEQETIPEIGHNFIDDHTVDPTCTDPGYTVKKCENCSTTVTSFVNALDHNYINGECSRCGLKEETGGTSSGGSTSTHSHTWKDATCDEPMICTASGCTTPPATQGSALGHSYTNGVCTRCGELETEGILNVWDLTNNGWGPGKTTATLLEDGTLEINGEGKYGIWDYDKPGSVGATDLCPITGRSRIKKVHIKGTCDNIGKYLFYYCTNIEEVIIDNPESITRIGEGAFFGCKKLKEFTIPKNITAIGARAFCHCHDLETLDFANATGLVRIGHEVARDCWSLKNVTLPEGLKVIGYEAFLNCIALKNVFIPSTVVAIGTLGTDPNANESGIGTSSQLTDDEKTIGNTKGYNNVFTIDFTRNVDQEDEYTSYIQLVLARNNISFDETAPTDNLIELLTETKVWYYSTNSVMKTYANQRADTEMVISEMSWDISENQDNSIIATLDTSGKLTITGTGKTKDYTTKNMPWYSIRKKINSIEISEGITTIGAYLLSDLENVNAISLPSTLEEIHFAAFMRCSKISTISIPQNVTNLEGYTFSDCYLLKIITIPSGITYLKGGTFNNCWNLETVNFSADIKTIGEKEFFNCISLQSIVIPVEIEEVRDNAFGVDGSGISNSIWDDLYNNGEHINLVITYYEDSSIMSDYIQKEENKIAKREYSEIGIDGITVETPYKNSYIEGKELETEALVLQITYDNNETRKIPGNTESIEYEKTQLDTVGEDNITLTYYENTTSITVNVDHNWVRITGECMACGEVCKHKEWEQANQNRHVCTICNYMSEHTFNIEKATCTEDRYCTSCNYVIDQTISSSGEHTWNAETGKCTVCGIECKHELDALTGKCGICGLTCKHEECEKATRENHVCIKCDKLLEHTWDNGKCIICGEVCTVHNWNNGVCTKCRKECVHEWNSETGVCTICENNCLHDWVDGICTECEKECTHEWNQGEVTKEATCEEEGTKTYTCTVCQGTKTETIEKAAHSYAAEFTIDKEATCVEAGSKSKHCATCDAKAEITEIPATGVHTWDKGEVTKEATCEEEGIKTYTCTVCNGIKTEEIEALEHSYEDKVIHPTCTERGYTSHICTRCQDSYVDTYTNALGHNYENGKCTECEVDEPKVSITSDEYIVDSLNCYITHIQPKTTIESFKNNININIGTELIIYEGNSIITDEVKYIKTGMIVKLEYGEDKETFILVVRGDVDKDGEVTFWDMIEINKHRLGKTTLEDICVIAGNVDETDNNLDFWDILQINKYRLGKLLKL